MNKKNFTSTPKPFFGLQKRKQPVINPEFESIRNILPAATSTPKKSSGKTASYNYLSLEKVFNLFPIPQSEKVYVSVHAIIQMYSDEKEELTIMDETRRKFTIFAPILKYRNAENKRLPVRPGDIIRFHRLILNPDFSRRCSDATSIVIFESFRNEPFSPVHLSMNPTFEKQDKERIEQLTEFNINHLINPSIRKNFYSSYSLVDVALQVLCTLNWDRRTILACWPAQPFDQHPCMPLIKLEQILDTLEDCHENNIYTESYLRKAYEEQKIVFISVYGLHRTVALILKPLDTIIAYNLLIKSDKFYFKNFSFVIYDGLEFGRCIRRAEPNSKIACLLRNEILNKGLMNNSVLNSQDFNQSVSQIISSSSINRINQESEENNPVEQEKGVEKKRLLQALNLQDISNFFTETLNETQLKNIDFSSVKDFRIVCRHIDLSNNDKAFICYCLYNFEGSRYLSNHASHLRDFNEIQKFKRVEEFLFRVEARFYSLLLSGIDSQLFKSMSALRRYLTKVQCLKCSYTDSFPAFLSKSKLYKELDENVVERKKRKRGTNQASFLTQSKIKSEKLIACPNCQKYFCFLCLNIPFILKDYDDNLLIAYFSGNEANSFFLTSTEELCSNDCQVLKRLSVMLKFMAHLTSDRSECSRKLSWFLCAEDNKMNVVSESEKNQSIGPDGDSSMNNGSNRDDGQMDFRTYRVASVSIMVKDVDCGVNTN